METNIELPYYIFRVVWVSKTSPLQENNIISYPYTDWWNKLLLTCFVVAQPKKDSLFSKNNSVSQHPKKIMGQSYRKPHCKVNLNFWCMILHLYVDNNWWSCDLFTNWCLLIDLQKAFDRSKNYPDVGDDEHGEYCDVTSESLSNNKPNQHFLNLSKKLYNQHAEDSVGRISSTQHKQDFYNEIQRNHRSPTSHSFYTPGSSAKSSEIGTSAQCDERSSSIDTIGVGTNFKFWHRNYNINYIYFSVINVLINFIRRTKETILY